MFTIRQNILVLIIFCNFNHTLIRLAKVRDASNNVAQCTTHLTHFCGCVGRGGRWEGAFLFLWFREISRIFFHNDKTCIFPAKFHSITTFVSYLSLAINKCVSFACKSLKKTHNSRGIQRRKRNTFYAFQPIKFIAL